MTTTAATTTTNKVPVTERAQIQRINRKLAKVDEQLHRSRPFYDQGRGPYFDHNLGEFYIVNTNRNWLIASDVDLEGLARELGALRAWEALVR